ncbi:MAG: DUF1893 domain-containing protein [Clostridia bacterium]|nr:DUF1893 domain-containing protein [Clostridia bacterium]
MNKLLAEAAQRLDKENTSIFVLGRGEPYSSLARGIAPIIQPMEQDPDFFRETFVADKVIGRAAALLLIKGGIRGLYAKVISTSAVEVLKDTGIELHFEQEVPRILNRTGDGFCPMETATQGITDPEEAFRVLQKKRKEMGKH